MAGFFFRFRRGLLGLKPAQIHALDPIEFQISKKVRISQISDDAFLFNKVVNWPIPTQPPYRIFSPCERTGCDSSVRLDLYDSPIETQCGACGTTYIFSPRTDSVTLDITPSLLPLAATPECFRFDLSLEPTTILGKQYVKAGNKEKKISEKEGVESSEVCKHGLPVVWCGICSSKPMAIEEKRPTGFDVFDQILPLLQPPLGTDFENKVSFPHDLYPYQRIGIKFLVENERALLADEMGLGKSIQTIVALRALFRRGSVKNALIVCPRSLIIDWEEKLFEWGPELRISRLHGSPTERKLARQMAAHVYITTYETLRRDMANAEDGDDFVSFSRTEFDICIFDEIQTVKNPKAGITRAVKKLVSKRSWGLSGTPLENRIEDIAAIFSVLKPGLLNPRQLRNHNAIREIISPYVLRRKKQDVLMDLPEKRRDYKWLDLTDSQHETYRTAAIQGRIQLTREGEHLTIKHVLALITKLKQICNFEPVSKESSKIDYLIETLEDDLAGGGKALIFSQYPNLTFDILKERLSYFNPLTFDGTLTDAQRDRVLREFRKNPDRKVLLMSVRAGGLGLTLTEANLVYHFDLWWNPAVADQAEARAHRIGQKRVVFSNVLVTKGTIEEKIVKLLKKKEKIFEKVIGGLEDHEIQRALSEEEIFGLFDLKPPKRRRDPV